MLSPEVYKTIVENAPILCVDGLIRYGNKYLLVLRKNEPLQGEWWPPGGRVNKDEMVDDAIIRKMKEEVGLDVDIESIAGYFERTWEKSAQGVPSHTFSVVYLLTPRHEDVVLDDQSADWKWGDIPTLLLKGLRK